VSLDENPVPTSLMAFDFLSIIAKQHLPSHHLPSHLPKAHNNHLPTHNNLTKYQDKLGLG